LVFHSYPGEVLPVKDMKAHTEVEVELHPFFPLALDRRVAISHPGHFILWNKPR
jgi:hypothetical protein